MSAGQPATLCAAFQRTAGTAPDAVALRSFETGRTLTWGEYAARVRTIAAQLAGLGVRRGDTVGFMLANRPEFHLCDAAAMHLGATCYSVYNLSAPDQLAHIAGHANSRVMITEAVFADRLRRAVPDVEHILCIDDGDVDRLPADPAFEFDAAWRAVQPDDVVALIYTSGTTGAPKGAELTHANLIGCAKALTSVARFRRGDRLVSYLPAAHLANRGISHYFGMIYGFEVTTLADVPSLGPALAATRPTVLAGVPRVWEKIKAGVERNLQAKPQLNAAFVAGDGAIREIVRARLGLGEVRWAVSGGAALAPDVHQFFLDLGVPVGGLWGMSECGLGASSPPDGIRMGTVGRFLPGYEARVAGDGELLVRGVGVMRGYRNDPDKTAEAVDPDGWLHTGDIATIDEDGYVRIFDRKQELIVSAEGETMSPANIANAVTSASPFIGNVMVVGDGRPYNVALIVLDPDAAAGFAVHHGLDTDPASVAKDERIQASVAAAVDAGNAALSPAEQIERFTVLPLHWLPGGDELTPTLRLRRRQIAAKYAAEIDRLYREDATRSRARSCATP